MKKVLREPLLHFLILGAGIYFLAALFSSTEQEDNIIVVKEGRIVQLETMFTKTWQRKPTKQELEKIVLDYVLEQAAYNEGVRLGLDRNDIVVMRRLKQKLDFIAEEYVKRPEPTDFVLQDYLKSNADKFNLDNIVSFRHIFFDVSKHGDRIFQLAQATLDRIRENPEVSIESIGDRYLFNSFYSNKSFDEIGRIFGREFIKNLSTLSSKQWHEAIRSSYGLHLIYIEKKTQSSLPVLTDIREIVKREWENDLRTKSIQIYYKDLLEKSKVVINWPKNKFMEK